jgi:hypothetical protein
MEIEDWVETWKSSLEDQALKPRLGHDFSEDSKTKDTHSRHP